MVSDDLLMEKFVLKEGNAINLIHNISSRASIDLDYSMKGDFNKEELIDIQNRITKVLTGTFMDFQFYYMVYT